MKIIHPTGVSFSDGNFDDDDDDDSVSNEDNSLDSNPILSRYILQIVIT